VDVWCEDCVAGLSQRLEPGSVDVVVTSPPYNLGTRYKKYDDTLARQDYVDWMGHWGQAVHGALSDGGSLFLNIGGKPSDPWGPFEVLMKLRQHFELQNVIHWIKSIAIQKEDVGRYPGITGNVSVGHYKPINSPRYVNDCHEYIFHLTKTGNVPLDRLAVGVEYQDKSNVARWNGAKEDVRCRGNTWFVPYRTIQSRDKQRPHPATFPVKIPEMCVRLHGLDRTRRVADPFLGIGSSAVACVQLGVDFVGFESDVDYWSQACVTVDEALAARTKETT
jgi:site-specific DNA-methyltransferase (adenine-specific)